MLKTIRSLPIFERDVKKLKKKHADLSQLERAITAVFEEDADKLKSLDNHFLRGKWYGYQELHVANDWLLIYRIEKEELELVLTRTVSHDDLL